MEEPSFLSPIAGKKCVVLAQLYRQSAYALGQAESNGSSELVNGCFSVTKSTLELQMSICLALKEILHNLPIETILHFRMVSTYVTSHTPPETHRVMLRVLAHK